jgi:hypothetical protein
MSFSSAEKFVVPLMTIIATIMLQSIISTSWLISDGKLKLYNIFLGRKPLLQLILHATFQFNTIMSTSYSKMALMINF